MYTEMFHLLNFDKLLRVLELTLHYLKIQMEEVSTSAGTSLVNRMIVEVVSSLKQTTINGDFI